MKKRGEKLTVAILVLCLIFIAGNANAAVRKGVRLVIEKTDGQEVSGELVSVKKDSLLILDEATEQDNTVSMSSIDVITVDNKSLMFELGAGFGLLAGASRLALHSALEKDVKNTEGATEHQVQEVWFWGLGGVAVGVVAGAIAGMNKRITVSGKTEAEIQEIIQKLSKKAQVKGIQ